LSHELEHVKTEITSAEILQVLLWQLPSLTSWLDYIPGWHVAL